MNKYLECNAKDIATILFDVIKYTPKNRKFPVVVIAGETGSGKTTLIQDIGLAIKKPVIVCELAGMEPPDIVGLPTVKDDTCVFTKPWWFNSLKDSNADRKSVNQEWVAELKKLAKDIGVDKENLPDRILFMDEINRAHPDTQSTIMNILLEQRHQGDSMKYRTLIVGAGNISDNVDYAVNEFSPAVRDRVRIVSFTPSFEDWKNYAKGKIHPGIISYVKKNQKIIINFHPKSGQVSLRTMFTLGELLKDFDVDNATRARLLIGTFLPINIVENVYKEVVDASKTVNPDDVLYGFVKNKNNCKNLVQEAIASERIDIISNLNDAIFDKIKDVNARSIKKIVSNFVSYVQMLPKPYAFGLITKINNAASISGNNRKKYEDLLIHYFNEDDSLIEMLKEIDKKY